MAHDLLEARLRQLAGRFLAGLPGDLAALREAFRAGDAGAMGAVVHRIAGRAGTFGFPLIGARASDLETLIAEGRWPETAFETALGQLEALAAEAAEAAR